MPRGVFVTGTDTGVGKTAVSAALMWKYRACRPRYWKPIQTGIEQDDDTATVRTMAACESAGIVDAGVRLCRPLSPHRAAALAGTPIDVDDVIRIREAEHTRAEPWVVEGAGGVLVPINAEILMIDLPARLALPVLVVARSTLGTINHTLLTIEALRARSLSIAGVVMVGPPDAGNREAIEQYGRVAVVGEMPRFEPFAPEPLRRWADMDLDSYRCLTPLFTS